MKSRFPSLKLRLRRLRRANQTLIRAKPTRRPQARGWSRPAQRFVHVFAGVLLFIVGAGLAFTVWLLPLGLPMALLGAALVWAKH